MQISLEERKKAMERVTWWGVLINIMLAVSKLLVGFIAQSHALIADGFHSLSDLISDAMVLFATKHAHQEADEDHPYGHARYETLATIGVGVFLIAVASGISIDAIQRLMDPVVVSAPASFALWVAVLSIFSNELLYQYTIKVAHRLRSKLLEANAWHHRTDSISSIVVFIGIAGAMVGWPILDDVAAIIVGLMIAKIGWDLSRKSMQELVDTALEPEILDSVKKHIKKINGVDELHMLRSRRMGHNALVDVHILVNSKLSVSEGHQISEAVEFTLIKNFDEINDVTVHIDPEDDEIVPNSCKHLPLRDQVLLSLQENWAAIPETQHITGTTLHYLNGKIEVIVELPLSILKSLEETQELKNKLEQSALNIENIRKLQVHFL